MLRRFEIKRLAAAALAAVAMRAACADAAHLVAAADLQLDRCVAALEADAASAASDCPGFLRAPLAAAREACRAAGGKLAPAARPNVWALDVNGDGRDEYAFAYDGVAACAGAASAFSCGSSGCPKQLYGERAGAWTRLGELYVDSVAALEVLAAARDGYRDLRVGCGAVEPCNERWRYVWRGDHYERLELDARGFRVAFADSVHGLRASDGDIAVFAAPRPDAAVLAVYPSRTELAIVGTVVGADYYYVSPCNACESGFVPTSALKAD